MDKILKNLKCFTKNKKKIHLLCGCEDDIIDSISQLLYNFLHEKFDLKSKTKIRRKLFPIRKSIRKLADKRASTRKKRQILIDKTVRSIIYPFIKKTLVPALEKSLKK